jgi:hypothetical protein
MRARSRPVLTTVVVILFGCGGHETATTSTEVPCDQVKWGFQTNNLDGSAFSGVTLRPGQSIRTTLESLWIPPQGRIVTGACDDKLSDLRWESSDSSVASVNSASNRSAVVAADSAGTVDITCRFLFDHVTQRSTYLRIIVSP